MYERFQQRLQKEGLADAEGKPTEKTLEIRRQIVERKAEREKQAESLDAQLTARKTRVDAL